MGKLGINSNLQSLPLLSLPKGNRYVVTKTEMMQYES